MRDCTICRHKSVVFNTAVLKKKTTLLTVQAEAENKVKQITGRGVVEFLRNSLLLLANNRRIPWTLRPVLKPSEIRIRPGYVWEKIDSINTFQ